jgi:hypothetical protein
MIPSPVSINSLSARSLVFREQEEVLAEPKMENRENLEIKKKPIFKISKHKRYNYALKHKEMTDNLDYTKDFEYFKNRFA